MFEYFFCNFDLLPYRGLSKVQLHPAGHAQKMRWIMEDNFANRYAGEKRKNREYGKERE